MRIKSPAVIACFVLAVFMSFAGASHAATEPVTVKQDGTGNYTTIQDAINTVAPGTTINVHAGANVYAGATVDKLVRLIGVRSPKVGPGTDTVGPLAVGFHVSGFATTANGTPPEISGFVFNNVDAPIYVSGVNYLVITGNTMTNPVQGITLWGCSKCRIVGNKITTLRSEGGGGALGIFSGSNSTASSTCVITNNKIIGEAAVGDAPYGGGICLYTGANAARNSDSRVYYNNVALAKVGMGDVKISDIILDQVDPVDPFSGLSDCDLRDNNVRANKLGGTGQGLAQHPSELAAFCNNQVIFNFVVPATTTAPLAIGEPVGRHVNPF